MSTLVRILNGYLDEQRGVGKESDVVTKDLFGSSTSCSSSISRIESKDVDLDLQAPSGWEKRLDLKVVISSFIYRKNYFFYVQQTLNYFH